MTNMNTATMLLLLAANTIASFAFLHPEISTTRTHRTTPSFLHRAAAPVATARHAAANLEGQLTLDGVEIRQPVELLGNILMVKVKDTLTATLGGILLPDQSKERPTEGLVLEAGPGKLHPHTGVLLKNPVEPGMSVLYGKFDGKPVEYKGEECQIIRDDDILLAYTGVQIRLDNVVPIRDYVLIELDAKFGDDPVSTKSGVVIAAQVYKDDVPCEGKVVKVGEGRMSSSGKCTPSPVQPGDMVKFKDYGGNDVVIEGKPYSAVKMVDILCTYQDDDGDDAQA